MAFNKAAVDAARQFVNQISGHQADPWSMFPVIKVMSGEVHVVRLLVPLTLSLDLWIHDWRGEFHTRTICSAAHYGRDCEICKMKNRFGTFCTPKFFRLLLAWDYSLLGATWTPESGNNAGIPQPILPFGVLSIPKGEEFTNWNVLEQANTHGYGFPDSPTPGMLWQVSYVPEAGFQPPSSVPEAVLGNTLKTVDAGLLDWISKASPDDIYAQYFATCHDVDWNLFGLQKPADHPKQSGTQQQQAPAGQLAAPGSVKRGGRKTQTRTQGPGVQQQPQQLQLVGGYQQAPGNFQGNAIGAPQNQAAFIGNQVPGAQQPGVIQQPYQQQGLVLPGMPGYGVPQQAQQAPAQQQMQQFPTGQFQQPQQIQQQPVQQQFPYQQQVPAQEQQYVGQQQAGFPEAPPPGFQQATQQIQQQYSQPQVQQQPQQQQVQPSQFQNPAPAFPGFGQTQPAGQLPPAPVQTEAPVGFPQHIPPVPHGLDINQQYQNAQSQAASAMAAMGITPHQQQGHVQPAQQVQQQPVQQIQQQPIQQAQPTQVESNLLAQMAGAQSQLQPQQQAFPTGIFQQQAQLPQQAAEQDSSQGVPDKQLEAERLKQQLAQYAQQGGIPAAGADEYVPPTGRRRTLTT